jgi:hypothetical protein
VGGYAAAPVGGVPPRMAGMTKPMGGMPPRIDPRMMSTTQPVMGGLEQTTNGPGSPAPMQPPMMTQRMPMPMKPAGYDPRGGPIAPPPGADPFVQGGPRVPPNLRGYMQREMMMNRPRRGIPGPAGAGGAPNRVGQSDQQGGLARALQRGTGRPPMSRRQGFYR